MTSPHYNKVREAVIKAVPEIMELKSGCMVSVPSMYPNDLPKMNITLGAQTTRYDEWYITDAQDVIVKIDPAVEILGRPIRLADVLVAIEENKKEVETSLYGGKLLIGHYDKTSYYSKCYYELREDDLSKQSPETIEFLANLLQ